jgi:hypothetical protein
MPKVGKKHFPYTKAGYKAAATERKQMPDSRKISEKLKKAK